jgi:hypothetical protein
LSSNRQGFVRAESATLVSGPLDYVTGELVALLQDFGEFSLVSEYVLDDNGVVEPCPRRVWSISTKSMLPVSRPGKLNRSRVGQALLALRAFE